MGYRVLTCIHTIVVPPKDMRRGTRKLATRRFCYYGMDMLKAPCVGAIVSSVSQQAVYCCQGLMRSLFNNKHSRLTLKYKLLFCPIPRSTGVSGMRIGGWRVFPEGRRRPVALTAPERTRR